jgi:putative SOS response-associated peptidase YedK
MCGRFVSSSPPDEIADYFGAAAPEALLPDNYNVAPTTDIYAVRERSVAESEEPERVVETFHWGLIPMWAKEQKIGNRMINARSETLLSKNVFKPALTKRRCLIPADGFYEWKVVGKDEKGKPKKQPMFIHRIDGEPIVMAGLWERWRGPERDWDDALHSTTIITTSANSFMADIHDRMPAMISPANWDLWLDPANDDAEAMMGLLVPAPEGLLAAYPVDPQVGNVRNNGAELIEPYDPPTETLFD